MPMPERNGSLEKYRFGFNGQEKVNEIAGAGNFNEFKYRIHDARLGRFMSVDPLSKEYPWNSTYAFAENRVIDGIDLEGAEYMSVHAKIYYVGNGNVMLNKANAHNYTNNMTNGLVAIVANFYNFFHGFSKNSPPLTRAKDIKPKNASMTDILDFGSLKPQSDFRIKNNTKIPRFISQRPGFSRPNVTVPIHQIPNTRAGRAAGGVDVIVEGVGTVLEAIGNWQIDDDYSEGQKQHKVFTPLILRDMGKAARLGMISDRILNDEEALSGIANYLLDGQEYESFTHKFTNDIELKKSEKQYMNEINETAKRISKEISGNYRGD